MAFLFRVGFEFDPFGAAWEKKYRCVSDFFAVNPEAHIFQDTSHKGQNIGRWVSSQRVAYKKGQLEDYKIKKLNALPGWMWDASHLSASSISRTGRRPKRVR